MGGTASPKAKGTVGLIVLLLLCLGVCRASSATDCDKALSLFSAGMIQKNDDTAAGYYMQSIELCPGFIRPNELVGNWLRNKSEDEKAIGYFSKRHPWGQRTTSFTIFLRISCFGRGIWMKRTANSPSR
jgi:hypothetical protein